MRFATTALCGLLLASSATAQTHQKHTAAHDSAHAIVLSDADHLALHQLLLGHWTGALPAHHDSLSVRFENDDLHQMLMVQTQDGTAGFLIRGDSLQWKQKAGSSSCMAWTSVSALVAATKTAAKGAPEMKGTLLCGANQSQFTLKKVQGDAR